MRLCELRAQRTRASASAYTQRLRALMQRLAPLCLLKRKRPRNWTPCTPPPPPHTASRHQRQQLFPTILLAVFKRLRYMAVESIESIALAKSMERRAKHQRREPRVAVVLWSLSLVMRNWCEMPRSLRGTRLLFTTPHSRLPSSRSLAAYGRQQGCSLDFR